MSSARRLTSKSCLTLLNSAWDGFASAKGGAGQAPPNACDEKDFSSCRRGRRRWCRSATRPSRPSAGKAQARPSGRGFERSAGLWRVRAAWSPFFSFESLPYIPSTTPFYGWRERIALQDRVAGRYRVEVGDDHDDVEIRSVDAVGNALDGPDV